MLIVTWEDSCTIRGDEAIYGYDKIECNAERNKEERSTQMKSTQNTRNVNLVENDEDVMVDQHLLVLKRK